MRGVFRYKKTKPDFGHFSFKLPEGATLLTYTEHWLADEKIWKVYCDFLEDPRKPREERHFFLCNNGDDLDFLGEHADIYYAASYWSKGYSSHLFETTHLTPEERAKGKIDPKRFRSVSPPPRPRSEQAHN